MFNSMLYRVRTLPAIWRDNLVIFWFTWEKSSLAFLAMLALPILAVGFLVHFAYADRQRTEAELQRQIDLRCLAENIYYEARGEPLTGQYAVAEVTMNRVASRHFPDTVCEVVHEQHLDKRRRRYIGAFSWTEELESMPKPRGESWQQAMEAARTVYDREQTPIVPDALFYHAGSVNPRWARTKQEVARIGNHIFYR